MCLFRLIVKLSLYVMLQMNPFRICIRFIRVYSTWHGVDSQHDKFRRASLDSRI